ncbi:MAG: NAD(P)H-binding protein [Chloroflexaceae bacterium]|jgi:uncharacterized protein YbjT (DUF2867 family)|nr:NAD(P)H-binding protein [Chloroflexaceae bacterium]
MHALNATLVVAVLGCTGTVGTEVMRQLAEKPCTVRGVLRQQPRSYPIAPESQVAQVEYAIADHESEDQLCAALVGAEALFLLIGTNPGQVAIESRAIDAAQRAGVQRIVKLSAPMVAPPAWVEVAHWHRAIEARLAASGLEHCNLRPYAFMQNWLRNATPIQQFGTIVGSAGAAPRNYVDCRDVAAVATGLLLSNQPLPATAITLTGPDSLSNQDMAERIGRVTGSSIRAINVTRDEHYQMLVTQARLPAWLAQHIVELEELALRIPEPPTNSVAALLGRPARTMEAFLNEHRMAFMPARHPAPRRPTEFGLAAR